MDSVNLHPARLAQALPYPSQIDPSTVGEVGLALVEEAGWESFSLRAVATRLAVSPNALYRHVGDRAGLNIEVACAAARELHAALRKPQGARKELTRLTRLAHCYVDFGTQRGDAYAAFVAGKPDFGDERMERWLQPWKYVMDAVGPNVPLATGAAGIALLAMLHGRVDLSGSALRAASPTDGLSDAVTALVAGYVSLGKVEGPKPRRQKA